MKKSITIEYLTPLEFLATYCQKDFKTERKEIEEMAKMGIIEIIAAIQGEDEEKQCQILDVLQTFAKYVNYKYCTDHNIIHEYEKCPFCSLNLAV